MCSTLSNYRKVTMYRRFLIRKHPVQYALWLVGRPAHWLRKRLTGKAPF